MTNYRSIFFALFSGAVLFAVPSVAVRAADLAPKALIDVTAVGSEKRFEPAYGSEAQAHVARSTDAALPGLMVTISAGKAGWPGVILKPDTGDTWDLSAYGHIEARVTNTCAKTEGIALRVDNAGDWRDSPWNTEQVWLKPGTTDTIKVIFGYAYGEKPSYPLKSNAISQVMFFTGTASDAESFRIESLTASGPAAEKPALDPSSIRIKPRNGVLFGPGASLDPTTQVTMQGARASVSAGGALAATFSSTADDQWIKIQPAAGKWDLTSDCEVRVRVKNTGTAPITPTARVTSGNSTTDVASLNQPIAPGAEAELVVPFAASTPWKGIPNSGDRTSWDGQPGTGTKFASDAVDGIKISVNRNGATTLLVESITTDAPPIATPAWLGKRPPVEGDWVKTFDDEFTGKSIDTTKWNIYGPNYWDKATHWTKDDLILDGHGVTMRFEKKRGFQNDDPGGNETDYACGYLDSFGKWVQRYGYFEARVKLPTAPGLWPTFWLMPDRGAAAGEQWQREDTANGGMEFDIMEHLDRWGDHRYNIAMHWDGYGKDHKQTGNPFNYVQHDADGYITVGLLWTPGSAVYYCNGKVIASWQDPRISAIQSHFIIEETTGGWDNNAVDNAQLPADYKIDYVRVWQRKDLASSVDSPANLAK